jgi:hypothetical protein
MSRSSGNFALSINECHFLFYSLLFRPPGRIKHEKVMKFHITNNDGRNTERRLVKLQIHKKNTALGVVTPYSLVETCKHFGGTYCIQPQAFWWGLLLPTSGFLVKRVASIFRLFGALLHPNSGVFMERTTYTVSRFGGSYRFQIQAFWWNVLLQLQAFWLDVLLPISGIFAGCIAFTLRRFHGKYCFHLQAFCWNILLIPSEVLVERIASTFRSFDGTNCF